MAINQILQFGAGAGANVLTPADYNALVARASGFQSGVAKSIEVNTPLRQAAFIAAMIGQFIADQADVDVLDDGDVPGLKADFIAALRAYLQTQVASTPQAQAMADDTTTITPLKLSQALASATGYQAFTTPGVSTFTKPAGVNKVKVRVYGAGGGGASDGAVAPGPSGGGQGGYWEGVFDISAVSSVSVTVGAGGAGAASAGLNGAAGTASSFGAFCSAQGGAGGVRTASSPTGGTATGTSGFGWRGGFGGSSLTGAGAAFFGGAGGGGWSPFAATDTTRPDFPSMGGGGRISSPGAPGAHGAVFIEW